MSAPPIPRNSPSEAWPPAATTRPLAYADRATLEGQRTPYVASYHHGGVVIVKRFMHADGHDRHLADAREGQL